MTALAENTISPLDIPDAREAAHKASELQREVENGIRRASRNLAEAERQYRLKLTTRILHLHAQDKLAITMCGEVARGESEVADLRYKRDVAKGVLEAAQQQAYRYAADRRDLDTLLNWSRARDLRTDTPPPGWDGNTGEIRRVA